MKTKILIATICMSIMNFTGMFAQSKGEEKKVEIKTSAICGMCKSTIGKALSKEKGVITSSLDMKTKIITVTYDASKTNPEKIRKAITMAGYDADGMSADPSAYAKLDGCCKKNGN